MFNLNTQFLLKMFYKYQTNFWIANHTLNWPTHNLINKLAIHWKGQGTFHHICFPIFVCDVVKGKGKAVSINKPSLLQGNLIHTVIAPDLHASLTDTRIVIWKEVIKMVTKYEIRQSCGLSWDFPLSQFHHKAKRA